jgi:hypothetical protein
MKILPTVNKSDKRFLNVIDRFRLSLFLAAVCIILYVLHIGCPIRFATGISCPGCGMTRAVLSALRLDFNAAFYYHPLFFLTPVMYCFFLLEDYINPRLYKAFWIIIIILFCFAYFYRLIHGQNNVVVIDINHGIVLKSVYKIKYVWEALND